MVLDLALISIVVEAVMRSLLWEVPVLKRIDRKSLPRSWGKKISPRHLSPKVVPSLKYDFVRMGWCTLCTLLVTESMRLGMLLPAISSKSVSQTAISSSGFPHQCLGQD